MNLKDVRHLFRSVATLLVLVTLGTNTVAVVAEDYSGKSRTNQYHVVVTNNAVARTLTYDLNGNLTTEVTATSTPVRTFCPATAGRAS